jgi:hypothetical protein
MVGVAVGVTGVGVGGIEVPVGVTGTAVSVGSTDMASGSQAVIDSKDTISTRNAPGENRAFMAYSP